MPGSHPSRESVRRGSCRPRLAPTRRLLPRPLRKAHRAAAWEAVGRSQEALTNIKNTFSVKDAVRRKKRQASNLGKTLDTED